MYLRLLLTPLLVIMATEACWSVPPPIIQSDAPDYDFGTQLNTEEIQHTFLIRNAGGSPLVISNIRNGCGCTRSDLDRTTIPPNESASLSTKVSLKGHIGPKYVSIYLHSNDPTNPVFQCRISGIATVEVEISPREIRANLPPGPITPETEINIINRTGIPMNLQSASAPEAICGVRLVTNQPGVSYTLRAKLLTNDISQSVQGAIRLTTDHPRYPMLEIPVSITVVKNINAYPPEMTMRVSEPGQPSDSRYLIIKSSDEKPFTVKKVESLPPVIPVGIQSIKPNWVRLRIGPLLPTLSMTGTVIRVHTDNPDQPILDIPFKAFSP